MKGKVQGVFYRATAKKIADKYGIKGWMRNLKEGQVEATISGDKEQLKQFINWCKQGPEKALVETVLVTEVTETIFDSFKVMR